VEVGWAYTVSGTYRWIRCLFNFLLFTVQSTAPHKVHHILPGKATYYSFLKSQQEQISRNPLILWEFWPSWILMTARYGPYWSTILVFCILFFYFVLRPTNAPLIHKLSHSYMFRHYCVILRELVISTLPSYTSISNAAVGNTI
jgi:hypothetical protein